MTALGAGERRRQAADRHRLGARGRRLHRRRRCVARRRDGDRARLHRQGAVHARVFLRSFSWGHVRQLDLASAASCQRPRVWAAGAGPGAAPFTIDLDSTLCETYGLAKEGAAGRHGYTGVRGYHPLLAVAAGTGAVLMARLRAGRAKHRSRGRPLPRETVARVRDAGASGQLTVRADSGFYRRTPSSPSAASSDVRFSITIRQQPSVRRLIEAIAEEDWTPIPYWPCRAARMSPRRPTRRSSTRRTPAAVRTIVRTRQAGARLHQLALVVNYQLPRLHERSRRRARWSWRPTRSPPRRDRVRDLRDLKYGVGLNHLPVRAASPRTRRGSRCR